jgi:hypothetical protein
MGLRNFPQLQCGRTLRLSVTLPLGWRYEFVIIIFNWKGLVSFTATSPYGLEDGSYWHGKYSVDAIDCLELGPITSRAAKYPDNYCLLHTRWTFGIESKHLLILRQTKLAFGEKRTVKSEFLLLPHWNSRRPACNHNALSLFAVRTKLLYPRCSAQISDKEADQFRYYIA